MSSLTTIEKRYLEDLFEMSSGYVLDFSDSSFAEFFRTNFEIEINSDTYSFNGTSKAKRLRAVWEIEPDTIVGKVLEEMLLIVQYNKQKSGKTEQDSTYDKCREITNRILGMPLLKEVLEQQFLDKKFGSISLDKIPLDGAMLTILKARLLEANQCLQSNDPTTGNIHHRLVVQQELISFQGLP